MTKRSKRYEFFDKLDKGFNKVCCDITKAFKDPLDSDDTALFSELFLVYLDYHSGNITQTEKMAMVEKLEEEIWQRL
jgi:hypothetical protein